MIANEDKTVVQGNIVVCVPYGFADGLIKLLSLVCFHAGCFDICS